ncbi:MAG: FlgD immunoglobulin-like domain containing protein, partial [Acidobacteriota bacterium]
VAWGLNEDGRCDVPSPNADFVAIAAGSGHSMGLKSDGSVVAWGANGSGQCNVPSPNTGFVAVTAGWIHSLALKALLSVAACCQSSGTCIVTTQAECAAEGGLWVADGVPCVPDPCALLPGACCSGIDCWVTTPPACTPNGGTWMGPFTTCSPSLCLTIGACCNLENGNCQVLTALECEQETYPHSYSGGGTTCNPNLCPLPTGACCWADGTCTVETVAACGGADGSFLGGMTNCSPNPCPQPPGACCIALVCSVTTQMSCQGLWLGAGTVCTPNPCGPTGACCFDGGTCAVSTWAQCAYEGGQLYLGNGTVCEPNPCPTSGVGAAGLAMITAVRAAPNPFTGSTTLHLAGPPAIAARVLIFDAAGRLVRSVWEGSPDGSETAIKWNGKDESGREAPAGIYLVRVESTTGEATGRLIKTR